jgi:nucleotide-binding universal stress UspA family protein
MFKTIAWATDGSPSALQALTVAKGLAQDTGAKLVIINVQESVIGRTGILVDSNAATLAALHRRAEELQDENIDAAVLSSTASAGGAARVIVELAEDAGADLIVVGNRGHGPMTKLLLGSVASGLVKISRTAILMVPSQQPDRSTVSAETSAEFAASLA